MANVPAEITEPLYVIDMLLHSPMYPIPLVVAPPRTPYASELTAVEGLHPPSFVVFKVRQGLGCDAEYPALYTYIADSEGSSAHATRYNPFSGNRKQPVTPLATTVPAGILPESPPGGGLSTE